MIKVISRSAMKKMPWKNGQGMTTEIAIHPPDSCFPKDDFAWRLSSAQIDGANQFSKFPGYDRLLVVCQGDGLLLNGQKPLELLVPFRFSGEEQIDCALLGGSVVDLGLIYRRDLFRAEVEVIKIDLSPLRLTALTKCEHLLFCASGALQIAGFTMIEGDAVQIAGEELALLQIGPAPCICIHFEIQNS
jgi:environmental stress-induced protein Ves